MRLIDADELTEWLKNVTITDGIEFETGFKQILLDIKNQPTAYNPEEVVKQLEVKARFYNSASSIDQNIKTGVLLAIQIVKEGGVKHG